MDMNRIAYFVTAAETLNFTRTAERHHLMQSAVSRHISSMELELGVQLFERKNNLLSLTVAGELFYPEAKRLLQLYDEAVGRVRRGSADLEGSLVIGIGPHERFLMQKELRGFSERYPAIEVSILQHGYRALAEGLAAGTLDIIFSTFRCPKTIAGCRYKTIGRDHNLYLISKTHPLCLRGEPITVKDVGTLRMAVHCEANGPFSFEDVVASFSDTGIVPKSYVAVNSMEAKISLVESCDMMCACPSSLVDKYSDRLYVFYPSDAKSPSYPIPYCVTIMEQNRNPAANAFFDLIKELT